MLLASPTCRSITSRGTGPTALHLYSQGAMMGRDSEDAEKSKRGRVDVRAGQPLVFVEDWTAAEATPEPAPGLREAVSRVIATLKAYRDAVKSLLGGKYADTRDFAPSHLREPCDIAAICCKNG